MAKSIKHIKYLNNLTDVRILDKTNKPDNPINYIVELIFENEALCYFCEKENEAESILEEVIRLKKKGRSLDILREVVDGKEILVFSKKSRWTI